MGSSLVFVRGSGHGDGGAVHVHFPVTDLIEPGPGESVVSWGNLCGDGELELVCSVSCGVILVWC